MGAQSTSSQDYNSFAEKDQVRGAKCNLIHGLVALLHGALKLDDLT